MNIYGVIMAGGEGERFWPLSRKTHPKQFLNLDGKEVLINEAIMRLTAITDKIFIVTNRSQTEPLQKIVGDRIPAEHIIAEPTSRNTVACIGYAATEIVKRYGDGIMVITPSDAYVRDNGKFTEAIEVAVEAAASDRILVTIGIKPTYPATGYGYLRVANGEGKIKRVLKFKEKPNKRWAEWYVNSGEYLWNSGMFIWKASVILDIFRELLPDTYAALRKLAECEESDQKDSESEKIYSEIPSISIDYGIMEQAKNIFVVQGDFGWSDVGSWETYGLFHREDSCGNILVGDAVCLDTKHSIVYAGTKTIATVGVSDLIVVETADAILICPKERAQEVKRLVEHLKSQGRDDLL